MKEDLRTKEEPRMTREEPRMIREEPKTRGDPKTREDFMKCELQGCGVLSYRDTSSTNLVRLLGRHLKTQFALKLLKPVQQ